MSLEDFRKEQHRRQSSIRSIRDIVMAIIILSVGALMFFGKHIVYTQTIMKDKDPMMLYLFGSLCFLYGGFRLYRGLKRDA